MRIFLIRHGETAANAARIVQTPDVPLSDVGLAQAEQLAARLGELGIARVLSSDLRRAAMTAEMVSGRTGAPLELAAILQERNYGEVRGIAYDELGVDILAAAYEPPGGESWAEFHARIDRAWELVRLAAACCPGDLAVVTHGLVCFSLAERHLCLPGRMPAPIRWGNASLTEIDGSPPWRVTLLNCTAHLREPPRCNGI